VRGLLVATALALYASRGAEASCVADLQGKDASALVASMSSDEEWLSKGVGCYSEDPEGYPDRCDWETEIVKDSRLSNGRRLIELTSDHKTGSGNWHSIHIYGCVADRPRALFRGSWLYGASVEAITDSQVVVIHGAWKDGDPQCCPSERATEVFVWDAARGEYLHGSSTRMGP